MSLRERRFPRFLAWLLICLCFGESLLPDMVLCVEADGRVMIEPAIGGKCSDLVQVAPTGELVSPSTYCELCLDFPLANSVTHQLPRSISTLASLFSVPVMAAHPLLQPQAIAPYCFIALGQSLPAPSSALIALRSTLLLI